MTILTQGQTAKLFGVEVKTVRDLTRIHQIPTVPLPHNGNGIGFDSAAIRKLKKLLPVKLTQAESVA